MDDDLIHMNLEQLQQEVMKLRTAIRTHRDSSGHDLCWHHPDLWNTLPEKISPDIAVPAWPQFMRGCVRYRQSLDNLDSTHPIIDVEYAHPTPKQET